MRAITSRLLCVILCVLLLAGSLSASAESYDGKIINDGLVYASASKSSATKAVSAGTSVTILAYSGKWAKVKGGNQVAYIPANNVRLKTPVKMRALANAKIYQSASTDSASAKVTAGTKVSVYGKYGDFYLVKVGSKKGYMLQKRVAKNWVKMTNWNMGGSSLFPRGSYAYILDIDTGIIVKIKRMGGTLHADCEPATAADTAKLKKIAGGSFSWTTHAVILYTSGQYIACSINTMPHGDQTISNNNYNGQFCLHMIGSLTHGTKKVNNNHVSQIKRAYKWANS